MVQKMAEKTVKNDGFLKQNLNFNYSRFLKVTRLIPKATKSQESNILVKPKKTTSKNFIVKFIKCLNLPIFKGVKLVYLINLLHLVEFSCWDQKFDFWARSGQFWVKKP